MSFPNINQSIHFLPDPAGFAPPKEVGPMVFSPGSFGSPERGRVGPVNSGLSPLVGRVQLGSPAKRSPNKRAIRSDEGPSVLDSPLRKLPESPAKRQKTPDRHPTEEKGSPQRRSPRFSHVVSLEPPAFLETVFEPPQIDTPAKKCGALHSKLLELVWSDQFSMGEALSLMRDIDIAVFNYRKLNTEDSPLPLYEPTFFLRMCELKQLIQSDQGSPRDRREVLRLWQASFNTARSQMTLSQREDLLGYVRRSAILSGQAYQPIVEFWRTHYLPLDPHPDMRLCSNEELLMHVMRRSSEGLQNPAEDHPTLRKVQELARRMLESHKNGNPVAVARLYHCTTRPEYVPQSLEKGIQVRHNKLHPGAFFSTEIDASFGDYGLSASPDVVAARLRRARIERRCSRTEQGAVWVGATQPVPVLNDRVIVTKAADQDALREELQASGYSNTEIIPIEVQRRFDWYVKEIDRHVPVPPETSPKDLSAWSLPPEN